MALTGIKDVDLEILSNLDDRSLLNYCSTNKGNKQLCDNEIFWKKRLVKRFNEKASEYKPVNITWKNHYMQVVIDLDKFSKDPWAFLKYINWIKGDGVFLEYFPDPFKNPEVLKQGITIEIKIKMTDVLKSPEWVINNFYLLEIPNFQYNNIKYSTITPFKIFELLSKDLGENIFGVQIYEMKNSYSY